MSFILSDFRHYKLFDKKCMTYIVHPVLSLENKWNHKVDRIFCKPTLCLTVYKTHILVLSNAGHYNMIKHLHLWATFVKCEKKLCIHSQFIFPANFRSLTNCIFQFKFRLLLSGLLNRTIDSDIKVWNHVLFTLASDHDEQKTKPSYKIFR